MSKTFKTVLIVIAGLLALLMAAAAILAATFDPNDYKPQLIRLVQDKTQRTLSVPGDIKLSFFPKLGAELGQLSISEHKGKAEFASVESTRLSLALMPLLSRQLVVDRIRIEGLRATLRRHKDGSTNFDDLLARNEPAPEAQPGAGRQTFRFDIDGIQLENARLVFDDQQQARKLDIDGLDLETGRIAGGEPGKLQLEAHVKGIRPDIDARVMLKTGFTFDLDNKRYVLKGFEAALKGSLAEFSGLDLKLAGEVTGNTGPSLIASPHMTLTLAGKQGDAAIEARVTTPLTVNMESRLVELHKLTGAFTLPNPAGGTLALNATGNVAINYGKQTASAILNGNLDQSAFRAKLGLGGFSPPTYTFDIGIDQLDLDRYRAKPAGKPQATAGKAPALEPPMDFSALQKLRAAGSVRVGALKAAGIKTSNVRLDLRAADGRLEINPLSANLYGGSASGALSIAAGNPARFSMRQTLSGIDIGPLMKDAIGKDTLEGKGSVRMDVTSAGATVNQIKKGLNGSARAELRDGAIRGVNIAQAIREAKARIGELRGDEKPQGGTGSAEQKTDFSELTGSFRIVNGVAHNEDLSIKSPLVRVAGSGDIDLAEDRLDYLARTTIVSTLQGQGGPELQALKGLTVPVRLSGPFNAIGWRIDFAGMASELAKQKLDERKDELRAKAQKSMEEQKEKLRGQLREQLKGLLGK